jgi:C-terminal processing protease CtpA/Prc
MARATLQGLLDRLAPAVSLVVRNGGTTDAGTVTPFYSEAYDANTGYLRVGKLTGENVEKAVEALKAWRGKGVGAVVLDLRGTVASSDYDDAAGLAGLFCAKGTDIFSLTAPFHEVAHPEPNSASGLSPAQTRTFSAGAEPLFKGILVVLVDADTAEAPEAVAAVLQQCAKALVVGDRTAGRAYQFSEVPLNGAVLRVAVGQVVLADGKEPGESGLTPDIVVGIGPAAKKEVMRSITAKGIASVTNEHDRPHLNEAALVSGSNPEVDELEAEQSGQKPAAGLIDRQLQRALDLVTSISIFQAKGR